MAKVRALPLDFDPAGTDYAVTTVSDRLAIEAAPFDTEGYSVTVNGGTSAEVPVGTITVQVAHTNGERTAYTIAATKVDSVEVRITVPAGTDTAVFNAADSEIAPVGQRDLPPHPRRALYLDHDKAGILSCGGQL